jgi:DNA-binding FadR family transcriptional regulator
MFLTLKADDLGIDASKDRRVYKSVGESLAARIEAGEFTLGGRLPPERELAETYNVGRTIIRDALIMLEVKGLVEVRQGSGIYVTRQAYEKDILPEPESLGSPADPFELLQARQFFESHMARLAASQATDEDLAAITEAHDLHRQAAFGEAKESMDIGLHLAIARATHNSELVALVRHLWQRRDNNPLWLRIHVRIRDSYYRDRWVQDHDRILKALLKRDPDEAYVAMWTHIENAKTFLKGVLAEPESALEPILSIPSTPSNP